MAKSREEIINEYSEAMCDGDFAIEFREGSNQTKFMTPEQAKTLADEAEAANAAAANRNSGRSIFSKIR